MQASDFFLLVILLTLFLSSSIIDDGDPPTVNLSVSTAIIAEAAEVSTVTTTLSTYLSKDVMVTLTTSGTATGEGKDYTLASTTIIIPAGQSSGTTKITSVQDPLVESDETVIISIDKVTNPWYFFVFGDQQEIVTIIDDDDTSAPSGKLKQIVVCGSDLSYLDVLGSEIKWYDALSGGNILPLSTILIDGNVYYASQTINGYESVDRLAVSVELNFSNNQIAFSYQFKPPNAFSPNGDGINEIYTLSNLEDPSQNLPVDVCDDKFEYISFLDRTGVEVYKSYDRNFEWDGGSLSSGIYFYFIKYTISEYKGTITIFK